MIYRLFNIAYTLNARFFILDHTGNLIQYVQSVTEIICYIYNWQFRFFEHKMYFCMCIFSFFNTSVYCFYVNFVNENTRHSIYLSQQL